MGQNWDIFYNFNQVYLSARTIFPNVSALQTIVP